MNIIDVKIGEVKIVDNNDTLRAILGSCVGIGFIYKAQKICGLAHCLLPYAQVKNIEISARFVDQAIQSLITLMKIKQSDFSEMQAVVVGGGNMMGNLSDHNENLVGKLNAKAALLELKKIGIPIIHEDLEGEAGRRIFIYGETYSYKVEKIPKIKN